MGITIARMSVATGRAAGHHLQLTAAASRVQGLMRGRNVRRTMHNAKLEMYNSHGKLMPLHGTQPGCPGWYQFEEECFFYVGSEHDPRKMADDPLESVHYTEYRIMRAQNMDIRNAHL